MGKKDGSFPSPYLVIPDFSRSHMEKIGQRNQRYQDHQHHIRDCAGNIPGIF